MGTFEVSAGGVETAASIGGLPIMAHLNSFASALALSVSAASLGLLGCSADGGGGDQNTYPGVVGGGPGAGPVGVGNQPPVGAGNQPPVGAGNQPPGGVGNQPPG